MMILRPALVLIAVFTLLTGILIPLGFTGIATLVAPFEANGSLASRNGAIVGSALIGQDFEAPGDFHGRPSATTGPDPKDASRTIAIPYDAMSSGGSNLGPTSKALLDRVRADVASRRAAGGNGPVPADAVTTSASGLDPDISPANADGQVARIAAARHMTPAQVRTIVAAQTRGRVLGLFGEPRVNVLALNLALAADTHGP